MPVLFHYTDANGLLGILQSQKIRATNFSFLNDSTEVRYGLSVIRKVLNDLADETRVPVGSIEEALFAYAELSDLYVACFTKQPDDLNQWRGYGPLDSDRYALGFRTEGLRLRLDSAPRASVKTYFSQIEYSLDTQLNMIQSVIAARLSVTRSSGRSRTPWSIALELLELAATFKDSSFWHEQEWRVIVNSVSRNEVPVNFGVRAGRLRPYVNLCMANPGDQLPLVHLTLLPAGRLPGCPVAARPTEGTGSRRRHDQTSGYLTAN